MEQNDIDQFKNIISSEFLNFEDRFFDFDSYLYSRSLFNDFELIKDNLKNNKVNILDLGIGIGLSSWYLGKSGNNVIGCDIYYKKTKKNLSEEFNQREIWKTISKNSDNISFLGIGEDKFPFKENSFDYILAYAVIEHVEPQYINTWLREIYRVLKKGGLIFIFKCPQTTSISEQFCRLIGKKNHDILYSKKEIIALFKREKMENIHFKRKDLFPFFIPGNRKLQNIYDKVARDLFQIEYYLCITPLDRFSHNMEFIFKKT